MNVGVTTYTEKTVATKDSSNKIKSIFISSAGPETFQASYKACWIDTGY